MTKLDPDGEDYGSTSVDIEELIGKRIISADLNEDRLRLTFEDSSAYDIIDDGQNCCEHRYITCDDDDVSSLVGGVLTKIEAKEGNNIEVWYDAHETMFVEVATDKAHIMLVTHNEHNGYYGGFCLNISKV